MNGSLLLDASSLINLLKQGKLHLLKDSYIQWLTIYEALNAVWKESILLKNIGLNEARRLVEALVKAVSLAEILAPHPYREIFETAARDGITCYDASYIVLARKHNLTLVTEDKKLAKTAQKYVKTASITSLT